MRLAALRAATVVALLCVVANSIPAPARATGPGFHADQVLAGYKRPIYVTAHANPNLIYVVEQRGRIIVAQRADANSPWVRAGVFLDIRSKVAGPYVGRGLLGMAFDPNYATNGKFYVFYTRKNADPLLNGHSGDGCLGCKLRHASRPPDFGRPLTTALEDHHPDDDRTSRAVH